MKKFTSIPLVFLSLLVLFNACSGDQSARNSIEKTPANEFESKTANEKNKISSKKQILFFGNSLTAAYGIEEEEGFVSLIQNRIDSLKLNYICVNAGLSGETTAAGKNRIEWIMKNNEPDVFILELGGNDGLRGIDPQSSKANLLSIINVVRNKNPETKILLAGMEAPPNMGETYTKAFRGIYTELAQAYKLKLIPFLLEGVGGITDLNLKDGIHPNQKGQLIVTETIWKYLESML